MHNNRLATAGERKVYLNKQPGSRISSLFVLAVFGYVLACEHRLKCFQLSQLLVDKLYVWQEGMSQLSV